MKKLGLFIIVIFAAQLGFSQIFSWGLKGGINSSKISFSDFSIDKAPTISINPDEYNNLITFLQDNPTQEQQAQYLLDHPNTLILTAPKVSFNPSSYEVGFHFGAFARIKILGIFLQPELIFSQTNAGIDLNPQGFDVSTTINEVRSAKITYNNFDVPVMLGVKFGPAHICAGPVATFKLTSGFDSATKDLLKQINSENDLDVFTATKNATFGGQVGVGLTILKKVTLDVRYEFGLSKLGNKVTIGGHDFNTDQRGTQVIASIGYMF